jgi:CDP-6-deoxy-D-xylo-4-hexulose-3-dehydrase
MATCSFYPAHHITMGEGGFIATQTKEQEMVIKSLREWGRGCYCSGKGASCLRNGMCKKRFSNWIPALPDEVFDHKYVYEEIGYNLKPLDLQASMGLVQLEKLDSIIVKRKHNYKKLFEVFSRYEDKFILPDPQRHAQKMSSFALYRQVNDSFCQFILRSHLNSIRSYLRSK